MTRKNDPVLDQESLHIPTAMEVDTHPTPSAESSEEISQDEGGTLTDAAINDMDCAPPSPTLAMDSVAAAVIDAVAGTEAPADRTSPPTQISIATVVNVSPGSIQMPKHVRSLPPRGTLAKALLDAGLRPEATAAAALIHPMVVHPTRDGSGIQGYSNLEIASLLRLQNLATPVVLVQDTKAVRFLRSKPGLLIERLLHATHRTERLELALQLKDIDIWNVLFDEPPSDELIADLIGVSEKTLKKFLEECAGEKPGDGGNGDASE
jgi:hypothetical protein